MAIDDPRPSVGYVTPDPHEPPAQCVVSSIRVTVIGGHERVQVWSRGGLAGELIVSKGDGARLAAVHGLVAEVHRSCTPPPGDASDGGA